MAQALLLIGLPGSGKSTWASSWVAQHQCWQGVSTDAIRAQLFGAEAIQGPWPQIERELGRQLQDALRLMTQHRLDGIIVDATHCRRRNRRRMLQQLRGLGFEAIDGLWFDVPLAVCLQRNQGRMRQVPTAVIATMQRQLCGAPPLPDEGFRALYRLSPAVGDDRFFPRGTESHSLERT